MWWRAVKVAAAVGVFLVALAFLALLVAVTRPSIIWGVSGARLASSIGNGTCREAGDDWICHTSADPPTRYRVDVDWMGCWKGTRIQPARSADIPAERDGCIQLGDVITFD